MKFFKPTATLFFILIFFCSTLTFGQQGQIRWAKDGNSYYKIENDELMQYTLPSNSKTVLVTKTSLTPAGQNKSLPLRSYSFANDLSKMLIYTNSKKVWRLDTRGDYWILNLKTNELKQLGRTLPASSLMFAKFSPDGTKVAFVSDYNLYVEDLTTDKMTALTSDGTRKLISGTFDWVYEEELSCRDGFQWNPDSKHIAFWQIDATKIRDYFMVNNTDSAYSKIIPVEYPTVGQSPSPARIGVVNVTDQKKTWLNIPGDPQQHYLPRMEWNSATELFVQQLNRKQNESKIYSCNSQTGDAKLIFSEKDEAWIELFSFSGSSYALDYRQTLPWINSRKEFLWLSEKDGWTHLYRVAKDGSKETLITRGDYDVIDFLSADEKNNVVYFIASPTNATQRYLYKTKLDGKGKTELVSPAELQGTHSYNISPGARYARHSFSNAYTRSKNEFIELPNHKPLDEKESIKAKLGEAEEKKKVEFIKIKTEEGIEMDALVVKPKNFDPSKKYPLVFEVYTEPAGQSVRDSYGSGDNELYKGDMSEDGYIYMAIDNRGTPSPKGRAWRKCIYRKIGQINIRDQALAAKEILKWPYVDPDRIAVWGWSGGGSATLNLMFQYPDIYKTGIAVAAVGNQLTYDNIYQERYMGLPQENMEDFVKGSPITYAKNLKGNLLYIHGTGDDNVHFNNAEMLINELVKYHKQFQLMTYPNRTHSISEGEGTSEHLSALYTEYLKKYCPPGGR